MMDEFGATQRGIDEALREAGVRRSLDVRSDGMSWHAIDSCFKPAASLDILNIYLL